MLKPSERLSEKIELTVTPRQRLLIGREAARRGQFMTAYIRDRLELSIREVGEDEAHPVGTDSSNDVE